MKSDIMTTMRGTSTKCCKPWKALIRGLGDSPKPVQITELFGDASSLAEQWLTQTNESLALIKRVQSLVEGFEAVYGT